MCLLHFPGPSLPLSPTCSLFSSLAEKHLLNYQAVSFLSLGRFWITYLASLCRPIKHRQSHGHCLTSSAFIMLINSVTENEWWNNPILRDLKCLLPRGLILIVGNFTSHSPKSGLIEIERTRELQSGSFTFHPHSERPWYLSSLCNPPSVSDIALGRSIIRDNIFLKAFLFTWPDNRIPHSTRAL